MDFLNLHCHEIKIDSYDWRENNFNNQKIIQSNQKFKNSAFLRFPNFAGSKMDLTSKYREEVALILIKAGVEYLETTVTCLHFSAMATSGMARKRNPAIFPNRQNGR